MKRIYIAPNMEIVRVKALQILAGSANANGLSGFDGWGGEDNGTYEPE